MPGPLESLDWNPLSTAQEPAMPPISGTAQIDDELHRAYDGDCWHGPPLREILQGVTAEVAARKHPALAHSIWALVHHLTAWVEVVVVRITEWRAVTVPAA